MVPAYKLNESSKLDELKFTELESDIKKKAYSYFLQSDLYPVAFYLNNKTKFSCRAIRF
jgi:hypothetical protein